jgi:ClpP class serine protease
MPIVEVFTISETLKDGKPPVTRLVAKGHDNRGVDITITLKAEYKQDIDKYIPLFTGERRMIQFEQLDRKLDEWAVVEAHAEKCIAQADKVIAQQEAEKQLERRKKAFEMSELEEATAEKRGT